MKISKVVVKNFRSIQECEFSLASNITAIAGGNESGKSNSLLAISKFLEREDFGHEDKYQLSSEDPSIEITFDTFSPGETADLCSYLNISDISELSMLKTIDGYEITSPSFDLPVSSGEDEVEVTDGATDNEGEEKSTNENGTEEEIEDGEDEESESPETTEEATELVLDELPSCIFINTIEDLIVGRNILLSVLFPADGVAVPEKLSAVQSLLELGNITKPDLLDTDTSRRALVLKRKSAVIADKLRHAWSQEDIKISLDVDQTNLSILFRDGKNRPSGDESEDDTKWVWTLPENRSTGFRWFVTFYAMYLNQLSKSSNIVFLIDDAGAGLNKRAQEDLLREFERITKNESDQIKNQVLYVSHSKYMFRWDMRNQILVADKQAAVGTKIEDMWWAKYSKNELPPPLDELGVTWLDDLLENENLIVEGHSDGIVLQLIATIFSGQGIPEDPFKGYKLIPGNGMEGQFKLSKLCQFHQRSYLMLFDSDAPGLQSKSSADSKLLRNVDLATLAGTSGDKVVTVEDLLPVQKLIDATNIQGAAYFGQDWEPIVRLNKATTDGILPALEERLKRTLDHVKVDDFLDRKYFIVLEALKNISYEDFPVLKRDAVTAFFAQLSQTL